MALFTDEERAVATAVRGLIYANPFLPQRIAMERGLLGGDFNPSGAEWNLEPEREEVDNPNLQALRERIAALLEALRPRLRKGPPPGEEEADLFQSVALFHLYHRHEPDFSRFILESAGGRPPRGPVPFWRDFAAGFEGSLGQVQGGAPAAAHLFACMFQVRRAYHHVSHDIVGRSPAAARLRAAVWQSIFTHDLRRYWSSLFDRMEDFATLVVGPTGTGKELVARAVAHSRYIPFDPQTRVFARHFEDLFFPLNLEALPETLVESELFGHRRGAFTGATEDRAGWLESCPRWGTVFLDEIGDLGPAVQVKMLRVLQERVFHRLGETRPRAFTGKILAATHRTPADLLRTGAMREDFYYRLCSDVVRVPSLRERLEEDPGELRILLDHIAARTVGEGGEALAEEAAAWIDGHLGPGYPWPGNVRELEQCVRNILVRGSYEPPPAAGAGADPFEVTLAAMREGTIAAEEVLRRYAARVHARTGSYLETARRLGLDRRTVKAKVEAARRAGE